jgi:hypothetical protein
MLLFLSTMTMVTLSDHIMVMWIAIEATTLASAPLIYTHRSAASLEATWKYVLICSVGIALALLGSVFITLSMDVGGVNVPVSFSSLTDVAKPTGPAVAQNRLCFHPGGVRHQDGAGAHAHLAAGRPQRSPQPGFGAAFRCAAQLRLPGDFQNQQNHAGRRFGDFSGTILMTFGLASILAAATFILKQTEYKRLLAYSSIENMGIIAFGTGIGGIGAYGAVLCLIHHSLIKSSLFLSSGNILLGYGSRLIDGTGKLARRCPKLSWRFSAGLPASPGFHPLVFLSVNCSSSSAHSADIICWRRAFHPQHLRDLCRVCQPYHENLFRRFRCRRQVRGKRHHGLAPVRVVADFGGAVFLDAGNPVSQAIMNAVNHGRGVLMQDGFSSDRQWRSGAPGSGSPFGF